MERSVRTAAELVAAAGNPAVRRIVVDGELTGAPSVTLAPGQHLTGGGPGAAVLFADGTDGVRLSRDNEVSGLRLRVDPARRAIFNDTAVSELGTLRLSGVVATGQVQLLARDRVRGGQVLVDGLDIVAADLRDRAERPELLGVGVLQGAFTLWNQQPDPDVVLTAELRGISAGREEAPVRGSGVFVAGTPPVPAGGSGAAGTPGAAAGSRGGGLVVGVLETGAVFTDGGLAEGTHDTISGGVFVVSGAHVREVRNRGPVTTHGVNDMVLDNWGTVDTWVAEAPLTSYGRSGVGFVNFGAITSLRIEAPVTTHGIGARGFNVYRLDGHRGPTVETAEFHSITTHADAAIGIQMGQPIGRLIIREGIHTSGGAGESLVRGVLTRLSAHALSVQPGGRVDSIEVGGALSSAGGGVVAVDVRGEVGAMRVGGGISATGPGADAVRVDGGRVALSGTAVRASDGVAIRLVRADATLRDVHPSGAHGDVVVGE